MASRNHTEYVRAFKNVVKFFTALGRKPFYQRLDNESSAVLESYFKSQNITIQYCPPGQHRANSAERSIHTYENHVISTLATTDPAFPLPLWDKLLPQIEFCLNHLRPFKPNPTISAYAGIHGGSHNFRTQPIAPAGIKVVIHDKPSAHASWASHGVEGFYLGPALQHYRCYHVYVPSTSTTRVSDTVQWFPHGFLMPDPSPHDIATAAIADLSDALHALTSLPHQRTTTVNPFYPPPSPKTFGTSSACTRPHSRLRSLPHTHHCFHLHLLLYMLQPQNRGCCRPQPLSCYTPSTTSFPITSRPLFGTQSHCRLTSQYYCARTEGANYRAPYS
jgi:hypothetical protein